MVAGFSAYIQELAMSEAGAIKSDTKPSVPTILETYKIREGILAEAEARLAKAKGLVSQSAAELKEALKAGGTTGDDFRDLFLRAYGVEDKLEKAFRDL